MSRVNIKILNKYLKYPYNLVYRLYESKYTIAEFEDKKEGIINCKELDQSLDYVFNTLNPDDVEIVEAIYRDNKTLSDMAIQAGCTPERIRQREQKSLRKLKHRARIVILELGITEYKKPSRET